MPLPQQTDESVSSSSVHRSRWKDWLIGGESPPIEDVFALISPRLCAPLHHCVLLDPPKHLSVFPLAHPSVSHTHNTHTPAFTFLAPYNPPPPLTTSQCTLKHNTHAHANTHTPLTCSQTMESFPIHLTDSVHFLKSPSASALPLLFGISTPKVPVIFFTSPVSSFYSSPQISKKRKKLCAWTYLFYLTSCPFLRHDVGTFVV